MILLLLLVLVGSCDAFGPSNVSLKLPSKFTPEDVIAINSSEYVLVGMTNYENATILLINSTDETMTIIDQQLLPPCFPEFEPINSTTVLLWCTGYSSGCVPTTFVLLSITAQARISFGKVLSVPNDGSHCNYVPLVGPPGQGKNVEGVWFGGNAQNGAFIYFLDLSSFSLKTITNFQLPRNAGIFSGASSNASRSEDSLLLVDIVNESTYEIGSMDGETGKFLHKKTYNSYLPYTVIAGTANATGFEIGMSGQSALQITNWDWSTWTSQGDAISVPNSSYYSGGLVLAMSSNYTLIGAYQSAGKGTLSQISISSESGHALSLLDQLTVQTQISALCVGFDNTQAFMLSNASPNGPSLTRYPLN